MKNVYYFQPMVAFDNDKDFHHLTFGGLVYRDEAETHKPIIPYTTFEDLWDAVQHDKIPNSNAWHTLVRKRRYVEISTTDSRMVIFEDKFEPVFIRLDYKPVSPSTSLNTLMRQLPADEFIEYIKSKGVTLCGLLEDKSI